MILCDRTVSIGCMKVRGEIIASRSYIKLHWLYLKVVATRARAHICVEYGCVLEDII